MGSSIWLLHATSAAIQAPLGPPGVNPPSWPRLLLPRPRVRPHDPGRRPRRPPRPRDFRQARVDRTARRLLPPALRRGRARLPLAGPRVRGARIRRYRVPDRAVGPRRPGRDGPLHVGYGRAEAAVARAHGLRQEASLLWTHRAQRRLGRGLEAVHRSTFGQRLPLYRPNSLA